MSDPTTPAAAIATAAGITIAGITTGLQPELLIAGAAGGWWAMSYKEPLPALKRVARIVLSSLIAAWSTPLGASLINMPERLHLLQLPVALVLGLLAIDVMGQGIMTIVRRLIGRIGESK